MYILKTYFINQNILHAMTQHMLTMFDVELVGIFDAGLKIRFNKVSLVFKTVEKLDRKNSFSFFSTFAFNSRSGGRYL